jgi:hypothetical protein
VPEESNHKSQHMGSKDAHTGIKFSIWWRNKAPPGINPGGRVLFKYYPLWDDDIVPGSTIEHVDATAADERIIASAAEERVIARSCLDLAVLPRTAASPHH